MSPLATDPLPPVTGAGWAANPYSYAGNNPVGLSDPTGRHPLTDADLQAWTTTHPGMLASAWQATTSWLADNWEYVAGGAMVVAGGVLMATGVGGPAGLMLVSGGVDTILQKATTGTVNWGQVAVSGALGGFGGAGIAARAGLTGAKAATVAGASSGGISGSITSSYDYYSGPGPHTVLGSLTAAGEGTLAGTLLGGAGGAAGHAVSWQIMGALTHNPDAEVVVMGRNMPDRVVPYADLHNMSSYKGTPDLIHHALPDQSSAQHSVDLWLNKKWIDYQMLEGRPIVDIGEPSGYRPSNFYNMERSQVSGYANYSRDIQP